MNTVETIERPAPYSYEGIQDKGVRKFLEGSLEPAIQRVLKWPIPVSPAVRRFSDLLGLEAYDLFRIVDALRKKRVVDFIPERVSERRIVYHLDADGVRAIGVLCLPLRRELSNGRLTSLAEKIDWARTALGDHPLKERLHPLPLPAKSQKKEEVEVGDFEDGLITGIDLRDRERRLFLNNLLFNEGDEGKLKEAQDIDREKLVEIYNKVPSDVVEEVSFQKLRQLGILLHPDHVRMMAIISAAYRKDFTKWDPLLEYLTYPELRRLIADCICFWGKDSHSAANFLELFHKTVGQVQKDGSIPSPFYHWG